MSLHSAEVDEVRADSQSSLRFEVGTIGSINEAEVRATTDDHWQPENSSEFEVGSVNETSVSF
jgi:hypothetical protein